MSKKKKEFRSWVAFSWGHARMQGYIKTWKKKRNNNDDTNAESFILTHDAVQPLYEAGRGSSAWCDSADVASTLKFQIFFGIKWGES